MINHQRIHAAALLVSAAGFACNALGADRSWIAPGGAWHTPTNWSPGFLPGVNDHARIGNINGVQNGTIVMTSSVHVDALSLTDGMLLDANARSLRVGQTTIAGSNPVAGPGGTVERPSRLLLRSVDGLSLHTDDLNIFDGGVLDLTGYSIAQIREDMTIQPGSSVRGDGLLKFMSASTDTIVNNGTLRAGTGAGLSLQTAGGALVDLDGVSNTGVVDATDYDFDAFSGAKFSISSFALADDFGGQMLIGSAALVDMNLSQPWVLEPEGEIAFTGTPGLIAPGLLTGGPLDVYGLISAGGESTGLFRIYSSSTTFRPGSRVEISAGTVQIGSPSTEKVVVRGGQFETAPGALLAFDGPTEYRGNAVFTGVFHQSAEATVVAPTVIEAEIFDMDGLAGNNDWTINSTMVLNARRIDVEAEPNRFDDTLIIGAGFSGQLTVNLDDPNDAWAIGGTIKLNGSSQANFPLTRLSGSPVELTGDMEIAHRVRVNAGLSAANSARIDFITTNGLLRLTGRTSFASGIEFNGQGTLENANAGTMTLKGGLVLAEVVLVNNGRLDFGPTPGIVSVPRFEMSDFGRWRVNIGGFAPGSDHDLLTVTDAGAHLGGQLTVNLVDPGPASFQAQLGDEFTVLTAIGGVSGSFVSVPPTVADGLEYTWEVVYEPNAVKVRVASIAPAVCTADLNQDGLINFFDMLAFVDLYNNEQPGADLAAPFGVWNFFDITEFITTFTSGCP